MTFDPCFADQTYPDRDLRLAAFATDESQAQAAAQTWLTRIDPDQIVYAQHQMVARVLSRHAGVLGTGPKIIRLTGIKRQLWARANVNLTLLKPALTALADEVPHLRVMSQLLAIAQQNAVPAEGLDVIDMLARQNRKRQIAEALQSGGWQMTPWLMRHFDKATVMHFNSGATGRLRILLRSALPGHAPADLFGAQDAPLNRVTVQGVPMIGLSHQQSFTATMASAGRNHMLAGNWLHDLANLRKLGPLAVDAVPLAVMAQSIAALAWAREEAGVTYG